MILDWLARYFNIVKVTEYSTNTPYSIVPWRLVAGMIQYVLPSWLAGGEDPLDNLYSSLGLPDFYCIYSYLMQ